MDFLSHPDLITWSISRAEPRQMLAGALPPFLRSKDAASLNNACALFHLEGKVKVVCLCSQSYQQAESLRSSSAPGFHSQPGGPVSLLAGSHCHLGTEIPQALWITLSCPHTPALGHPPLRCNPKRSAHTVWALPCWAQ